MTGYAAEMVESYYDAMTDAYLAYGGATLALHTGLCAPSTPSKEHALLQSNEILVEGLRLGPGSRVLDLGCGLGGLAIFLAERHGVETVGVTLCDRHARMAARFAAERGVSALATFRRMDYMRLEFPDETFDAALSQDAFCYATDHSAYFAGVRRVLRPGGRWRAIDAFRNVQSQGPGYEDLEEAIRVGWLTPPFRRHEEVLTGLAGAGFVNGFTRDLSGLAKAPSLDFVQERIALSLRSGDGGPDGAVVFRRHMTACAAFGAAILEGKLSYMMVGAQKGKAGLPDAMP